MKTKYYICLAVLYVMLHVTPDLFGQKNVYVSLSNTKEINVPQENYISAINAGAVFGIGNYFFAGGGINATKVWGPGYSSLGIGSGPDVQIYFLKKPKLKLFLEGAGRVMYLFPEYPGMELNFAFWGGPSAEVFLSERHRLKFGACYNHLSNGKSHEQNYNQSLDGLGFTVGWVFY